MWEKKIEVALGTEKQPLILYYLHRASIAVPARALSAHCVLPSVITDAPWYLVDRYILFGNVAFKAKVELLLFWLDFKWPPITYTLGH